MQVSAYSQADILILGRLAKLSFVGIWTILCCKGNEQETPTSMLCITRFGKLHTFGVGFAYYLQQAVQSRNKIIAKFPRLLFYTFTTIAWG